MEAWTPCPHPKLGDCTPYIYRKSLKIEMRKQKLAGVVLEFAAALMMATNAIEAYPVPIWSLSSIASALAIISGSLLALS